MLTINQYVKAESLQQAYELNQKKNNVILGGMLWLKMQKKSVGTAIDLSDLGLDTIEETEDSYLIGAMVTLRTLELHKGINSMTNNAASESVKHIVGIQFRNLATIGGSIFGRYGFSDVLTIFMALDASVELYQKGIVSIEEFSKMPYDNDLLIRVIIKKQNRKVAYLSQRNTKTDFPVLTCAVSNIDGMYRCVVGARPKRAVCLYDTNGILKDGITQESAEKFGEFIKSQIITGSNMRGSEEYRKILSGVLSKRSLFKLKDYEVTSYAD
ncbi:MAG TPA: molybdopterin dehydrogenase [Lachnoclostridium phytofermentans]|uniref:Molybdopterin dehydrogenase n=1 Tax=Lachnoclostridium phytofermentans TaxID=66219 RepID=A0A3D2X2M4_9FIRM|nr:FAD binding domain-containing protein [Lachnoclostridium sp.]HCL01226.1 molybdopterin dehydrogenase [Lachnoclostridium phytofermentans]